MHFRAVMRSLLSEKISIDLNPRNYFFKGQFISKFSTLICYIFSQSQTSDSRTISRMRFTPTASDHGAKVFCRAYNPHLVGPGIKTSVILNVQCEFVELHWN